MTQLKKTGSPGGVGQGDMASRPHPRAIASLRWTPRRISNWASPWASTWASLRVASCSLLWVIWVSVGMGLASGCTPVVYSPQAPVSDDAHIEDDAYIDERPSGAADSDAAQTDAASLTPESGVDVGPSSASDGGVEYPEVSAGPRPVYPPGLQLRRLTRDAYNRTVRDLFGTELRPADAFPGDVIASGFDHLAEHQAVSPVQLELWQAAAEALAAEALRVTSPSPLTYTIPGVELLAEESFPSPGFGVALYTSTPISVSIEVEVADTYTLAVRAYGRDDKNLSKSIDLRAAVDGVDLGAVEVIEYPAAPEKMTWQVSLEPGVHQVALRYDNPAPVPDGESVDEVEWWEKPLLHIGDVSLQASASVVPGVNHAADWIDCSPEADGLIACLVEVLQPIAQRAWRRPLKDAEMQGLIDLAIAQLNLGVSFNQAVQTAFEAILLSPHFLFFVEVPPVGAPADTLTLTDHQLATRLSYFLWNSMPDDALMDAANQGTLSDPLVLRAEVERMLSDPKVEGMVHNLADQWLLGRELKGATPSVAHFPDFDEPLRAAMLAEVRQFIWTMLLEDRPLGALLTSPELYVDARLAAHYGVETDAAVGQLEVAEDPTGQRRGVMGLGGVLTALSHPTKTSPSRRGKWVATRLLCHHISAPPPDVADAPPEGEGTAKELIDQHAADPGCAACHALFDPYGFALEHFDGVGAYRDVDGDYPVDAVGELYDGAVVDGLVELSEHLADAPQMRRCAIENVFTWASGRLPTTLDVSGIDALEAAVDIDDLGFRALVIAIATSPHFRARLPEVEEGAP